MTDLMNNLYEFLTRHYISGMAQDPEYAKALGYAEAKQALLDQQLDDSQRRLLQGLLDEVELAHSMEQACLFRATLSLSRELSGLVRG